MSDDAKAKILARRARFLAAALAGMAACDGSDQPAAVTIDAKADVADTNMQDTWPQMCLSMATPDTGPRRTDDGGPQVCLSPLQPDADASDGDTMPEACLSPRFDMGVEDDSTIPRPCLAPPMKDVGVPDDTFDLGLPQICLSLPAQFDHAEDRRPDLPPKGRAS